MWRAPAPWGAAFGAALALSGGIAAAAGPEIDPWHPLDAEGVRNPPPYGLRLDDAQTVRDFPWSSNTLADASGADHRREPALGVRTGRQARGTPEGRVGAEDPRDLGDPAPRALDLTAVLGAGGGARDGGAAAPGQTVPTDGSPSTGEGSGGTDAQADGGAGGSEDASGHASGDPGQADADEPPASETASTDSDDVPAGPGASPAGPDPDAQGGGDSGDDGWFGVGLPPGSDVPDAGFHGQTVIIAEPTTAALLGLGLALLGAVAGLRALSTHVESAPTERKTS